MTYTQRLALIVSALLVQTCAPHYPEPDKTSAEPRLTDTIFCSFDGTELPLRSWLPAAHIRAVLIALHGYNDYSNFISDAAPFLNGHGIGLYAYDQRGFGETAQRGWWAGGETMCRDLRTFIALVQDRHPAAPLYLLGDSMGGAVILAAGSTDPLASDGVILVAPAVWSRQTMPFYQRWLLWLAARTIPGVRLSAESLDITPSDNREMLIALGRDPLVIKRSRIAAIHGLVNLMDEAYLAAQHFDQNVLFLYGARDEIIPPGPMAEVFRQRVQGKYSNRQRLVVYADGYHMLLRDLQAETVWNDILFWMNSADGSFPSVIEGKAYEINDAEDIDTVIFPGGNTK